MNPETNRFEEVKEVGGKLYLGDDAPVPPGWPVFKHGEIITLRRYRWRVDRMQGAELVLVGVGRVQTARNREKRNRRKRRK